MNDPLDRHARGSRGHPNRPAHVDHTAIGQRPVGILLLALGLSFARQEVAPFQPVAAGEAGGAAVSGSSRSASEPVLIVDQFDAATRRPASDLRTAPDPRGQKRPIGAAYSRLAGRIGGHRTGCRSPDIRRRWSG
jgi:hypothetical protein